MELRTATQSKWILPLIGLCSVLCCAAPVWAASGAAFLKLPAGARAVSMGGAASAVTNDVNALYWNPAGLVQIKHKELSFTHAELFSEVRHDFVGFAMPLRQGVSGGSLRDRGANGGYLGGAGRSAPRPFSRWTMGFSASYLHQDSLEGRDASGRKTGGFNASDLALQWSVGRAMNSRTSVGGSFKVIRQNIGSASASGWAMDAGLRTRLNKADVGLAIQNLGPSMKFTNETYALPMTLSVGAGYQATSGLLLSMDARHRPSDNVSEVGLGGEMELLSAFTLRAGYLSSLSPVQKTRDGLSSAAEQFAGLGLGFGFRARALRLDYALTPMGELGPAQRLTLSIKF